MLDTLKDKQLSPLTLCVFYFQAQRKAERIMYGMAIELSSRFIIANIIFCHISFIYIFPFVQVFESKTQISQHSTLNI